MGWTGVKPNQTFERTDGTRTGANVWVEADADGVDIVDTDHDTHDQGNTDALNEAYSRTGRNTPTEDLPMGANRFTNLGDAQAVNQALTFDQAQDNKHQYIPTVGGTADAITLTSPAGLTVGAYAAGQVFYFKAASANTGATTVAIDGLAATTIKRFDGSTELLADDIRSGSVAQIKFDGTNFQLDGASQTGGSADILARVVPTGATMFWGLDTIPAGWSKANGQALTKASFPELDAAYFLDSYPYGASSASLGVGTLNLPPAAGRFIRVVDEGAGLDPDKGSRADRGDGTTGDNVGTTQEDAFEEHQHDDTFKVPNHAHNSSTGNNFVTDATSTQIADTGSGTTVYQGLESVTGNPSATPDITGAVGNSSGGTASTETRPKNIYQYLIVLTNPTAASAASVGLFGYPYKFDTATADSLPANGFLRFDNATLSSATQMFIDFSDANGANVSNAIQTWDDSTSTIKGQIYISKVGAPSTYVLFDIDGATVNATGYHKVQVSHVSGNGTFAASDNISVEVYRTGDKGAAGDSGFSYLFDSSTTTGSDPGTGDIRLNNAAFASVTEIAISDLTNETGNPDLSAYLLTFDDSTNTNKGTLTLQKASAKENFAIYTVTALSDETNFVKYTVTHVDSAGSWSNTDELSLFFTSAGDAGAAGSAGAAGVDGGLPFTYSTNTDTGTDPGAGIMRGNSLTLASITQFAFDDTSAATGNPDVSALIATWDDSTNTAKGQLLIKKQTAPENFIAFDITSLTDQTGFTQIGGTVSDSAGSLSDTDALVVEFSRSGDAGAAGTNGTDGISSGLYFKFDSSTNTAADPTSGHWRANNATLSSATQLAISDLSNETGNPDVSGFIATWDDSTTVAIKGNLIIKNRDNPEEFVTYDIASITDQTTFYQIAVTGTAGAGTLTDEDDTVVEFYRVGDKGTDGAGAGDVVGPASATDNAVARYDTTTGKLIQNSVGILDDSGNLSGLNNVTQAGYTDLDEISTPADPGANVARVYAKDVTGTTRLYFKRGSAEVQIGEGSATSTLTFLATNDEGGALALGDIVCLDTVTPWNVSDARPNVEKADADVAAEMPSVGMVSIGGADGAEVTVTSYGEVTALDTSGDSAGASIYVDHATPGGYTTTRPEAATQLVQKLGTVLRSHVSAGVIFISGANRTNDIPNRMPSDRFRIADATDETKLVATDVSAITTATTRTITMPDENINLTPGTGSYAPRVANDVSIHTTTGTFASSSITNGATHVIVECWAAGGGGGGGDGDGSRGTGGGGGEYGYARIPVASLAASTTVTIGASGAGGTGSTTPTAGSVGGDTVFGDAGDVGAIVWVTVNGGLGGNEGSGSSLRSGVAGGSGAAFNGSVTDSFSITGSDSAPTIDATADVSHGGHSPRGGFGAIRNVGAAGNAPGGGGSGGNHGGGGGNGGAGAVGRIIITW